MVDAYTGTIVGAKGTILHTTNGGTPWTPQAPGPLYDLNRVWFTEVNNGTAVGASGWIIHTTNGGTTWTSQWSGTTNFLNGVAFTGANTGTVVGQRGTILHATTGGSTWTREEPALARQFCLEQNYPNPFNPSTTISYQLPTRSHVILKVFDILAREVTTLVNRVEEAGYRSVKFHAAGLSSGAYFYRLTADNLVQTRKLLLLR